MYKEFQTSLNSEKPVTVLFFHFLTQCVNYRNKFLLSFYVYGDESWSLIFKQVCLGPGRHDPVQRWYLIRICGSSVWYLFHVTILALGILRWFPDFRKKFCNPAGSGWNILILLESCLQNCMTYTIVVCTVKNS
jgi:hypothetical protein